MPIDAVSQFRDGLVDPLGFARREIGQQSTRVSVAAQRGEHSDGARIRVVGRDGEEGAQPPCHRPGRRGGRVRVHPDGRTGQSRADAVVRAALARAVGANQPDPAHVDERLGREFEAVPLHQQVGDVTAIGWRQHPQQQRADHTGTDRFADARFQYRESAGRDDGIGSGVGEYGAQRVHRVVEQFANPLRGRRIHRDATLSASAPRLGTTPPARGNDPCPLVGAQPCE